MFNLNKCDNACIKCIKQYKKKHSITSKEENPFRIRCQGIPKDYVDESLSSVLDAEQSNAAQTVLDPVRWAAETLDWHCLDPDGEIWKRKNPSEYDKWIKEHPGESLFGKSRYHRPYQAEALHCTSRYKVFRWGRRLGKTDCLVISTLYHAFVKPGLSENEGFRIVVMAPYQVQVETYFKRMEQLIYSSPELSNSIRHKVKSPIHMIELNNGSTIKGFTAGTKSNDGAMSIRGQDANMLLMDEADYLNQEDMDSALSITIDHPDAIVMVSSTPRGTREKFYEICHSRLYKESHYASYSNPMWSDEVDQFFKSNLTEMGYCHEIKAMFGEAQEGVFQHVYVDAAKLDYVYNQMIKQPNWVYGLGVDWNDTKIGTNITVVGYDPATMGFSVVDRQVVSREGWTQTAACNKIIEMNRAWHPSFIYVDKGFGSTQEEILKKFGYDALSNAGKGPGHPDSRLATIVKAYDFGGSVEVYDLITRQPIKKAAKPFLVENTVRYLESRTLHFSKNDEILDKQFRNYIVDRITPSGCPVYKALDEKIGDHALDSVMLAMVGFTLEKTDLGRPKFFLDFAFCGKFGEKIDANIANDDMLVVTKKKEAIKEKYKPELTRTGEFDQPSVLRKNLPAAHTTREGEGIKLWAWPGFGHDVPRPNLHSKVKSDRVVMPRPTRKNI